MTAEVTEISIIVPIYNVEKYLAECLDSLLQQTFRSIEIICVEDCSTDSSGCILDDYVKSDARVRKITHDSNKGLAAARNTGLAAAKGTFVIFVDSDDVVDRDLCLRTLDVARSSDADLVLYGFVSFRDGSTPESGKTDFMLKSVNPQDRESLLRIGAFAWTKLIRIDLIRSGRINFPVGRTYEDLPVHWSVITGATRIAILPQQLCCYRQRAGSISYRTGRTLLDLVSIFDIIEERLQRDGLHQKYFSVLCEQRALLFWHMFRRIDMHLKWIAFQSARSRMLGGSPATNPRLPLLARNFSRAIFGSAFAVGLLLVEQAAIIGFRPIRLTFARISTLMSNHA